MLHAVTWDGKHIIDHPYSLKVADCDRGSKLKSNNAFEKLYPKKQFKDWQVTRVFELQTTKWLG